MATLQSQLEDSQEVLCLLQAQRAELQAQVCPPLLSAPLIQVSRACTGEHSCIYRCEFYRLNTPVSSALRATNSIPSGVASSPLPGTPSCPEWKSPGPMGAVGPTNSWSLEIPRRPPLSRCPSPTEGKLSPLLHNRSVLPSLTLFLKIRNGHMLGFLPYARMNLCFLFLFS